MFVAFKNIFTNALQAIHGKSQGEIKIETSLVNGAVKLTIEDNGIGIEEQNISKLFYPFFSTGPKHGVGLGLTEAQNIVLAHKGRISVSSKLGEGSQFAILLKE